MKLTEAQARATARGEIGRSRRAAASIAGLAAIRRTASSVMSPGSLGNRVTCSVTVGGTNAQNSSSRSSSAGQTIPMRIGDAVTEFLPSDQNLGTAFRDQNGRARSRHTPDATDLMRAFLPVGERNYVSLRLSRQRRCKA